MGFKSMDKGKVEVVPDGYHRYFFGVKVKTVKLVGHVGGKNHTDDSIHSDHGYLDTWDNRLGPS